ncbi:MAG TPA: hypothetical protein VNF47_06625 [Streptosporangiaceae bacterium]|nr:hypothetical protein [Streptosporangiaceae bacterium]
MWRQLARHARPHAWSATTGLALGLLALGPALKAGFILSYDMVFVPDPPLGRADLGLAGGPPRAVPSDLVVAVAARIIPAEVVQRIALLAIFVLACSGAAALLAAWPTLPTRGDPPALLAQLVAGVCYAWNPFVAERLIMGQWALLLGYAGLPWVLREIRRGDQRIRPGPLCAALLPAAIGGFAAMSISALAASAVALCAPPSWPARVRGLVTVLGVVLLLSLIWLIPAFAVPFHADPNGIAAFAARSDTPFGPVGSLLMLGGIWNAEAVPAGYGSWASTGWLLLVLIAAGCSVLLAARQRICPGLGIAAVGGAVLAALGLSAPGRAVLAAAISLWSGFAVLRDGQQFLAPLSLAYAVGLGAGASWLLGHARRTRPAGSAAGPATALGILALLAPVLLLPGLAWGAAGRLHAVQYPADWLRARQIMASDQRPGSVLLLPWAEYRRYRWNNGEAVFDPWPRMLARTTIWNDALRVGPLTVAAESPQARMLTPIITSGQPITEALRAVGVRYVVIDAGPLLGDSGPHLASLAGLPGAQVVLASRDLILCRIPPRAGRE